MGTRSGDIDPAIVTFLAEKENISAKEVIDICNKKAGVLGLSNGVSSDFRDLVTAKEEGNQFAKDALDTYAYKVAKYIGAYAMAMKGLDVVVFTAGIGENNCPLREQICEYLATFDTKIDKEKNAIRGEEIIISTEDSKVKVLVIPTNEELAIARETVALV